MNFKRIGIVAIIVCLLFCVTVCNATCREDMNGIWSFGNDIRPPHYSTDEYYIFKDDKFLCVNTISGDSCGYCRYKRRVGCHLFGFSSEFFSVCDSLSNCGDNFAMIADQSRLCESWGAVSVDEESLEFIYNSCRRISDIPVKAKRVLFEESLSDRRNYAREFLNYDICSINKNCYLLDKKHRKTQVAIPKDAIVTVEETKGKYLEVKYEDEQGVVHSGFLKRDSLNFVDNE